jgi:hypothetical protein
VKIDYSKRKREGPGRSTVRNTEGRSFRELMREARLKRAFTRLEMRTDPALFVGSKYAHQVGDKDPNDFSQDEYTAIFNAYHLERSLARLFPLVAGSTGDIDALWDIVVTAFNLGVVAEPFPYQSYQQTQRAREMRVPWWHSEALGLAKKMKQKYPSYKTARIARDVYERLAKDKPGSPKSWETVRAHLRRNLDDWSTVRDGGLDDCAEVQDD